MKKLEAVIQKLKLENFDPKIKTETLNGKESRQIVWTGDSNDDYYIFEIDIVVEGGKIAWFQSSKKNRFLLKMYDGDSLFSWTPETYNPIFGCLCILLEWYKGALIFIYQEKHDIYICSITGGHVKYFNFHGAEIERKGDLISYETFTNQLKDKVRLIRIPDLAELEPIDKKDAEKLGLLPEGLNRPGNFLGIQ
jgi:hypothetical protein